MPKCVDHLFHRAPSSEPLLTVVRAIADKVVELAHEDGSVMRALMRRSALISADDRLALAAVQELPERPWKVGAPPRC